MQSVIHSQNDGYDVPAISAHRSRVSFNAFGADQRHESQYKHGKYTDQNAPALQWRHNERDGVSKSPAARLFTQPFIQAQIKENKEAKISIWLRHHNAFGAERCHESHIQTRQVYQSECSDWSNRPLSRLLVATTAVVLIWYRNTSMTSKQMQTFTSMLVRHWLIKTLPSN